MIDPTPDPELCTPIEAPDLPEGFPPVTVADPRVDVQWFSVESAWGDEVYVCRLGNGGTPPYSLIVFVLTPYPADPEPDVDEIPPVRFPAPPELFAIAGDICLKGAIFSMPSFVSGMDPPPLGDGSLTTLTQVGAVKGSPAGDRFELSGAGVPMDQLPGVFPGSAEA